MSIKVCLEIGHVAALKARATPEGYTHDWELFVRGPDGTDISHFVDKVVFNLHDSFPKPKRVVKEPPYAVKEAGYAGFILPVEVYFKNKGDEPKKRAFTYDLDLQERKVQREELAFPNPSDDFKRKLLKGGGTLSGSGGMSSDYKARHSSGGGGGVSGDKSQDKKYKKSSGESDSKVQNTFANLFGTPITKGASKVSPDPKQSSSGSSTMTNSPSTKRNPSPMAPVAVPAPPPAASSSVSKPEEAKSSTKHGGEKEKKKDKKDKKSYDKDRSEKKDRELKKDKESHDNKPDLTPGDKPKSDLIKPSRLDGVKLDSKLYSKEKKISDESSKVEAPVVQPSPPVSGSVEPPKRIDKPDSKEKDKEERKHKHKKKDKSKDKEKDRSSGSKDKKEKKEKDKSSSSKANFAPPPVREPEVVSPVKPAKLPDPVKVHPPVEALPATTAPPLQTMIKQLNENNSSDSEADSPPSLINDKDSENSNSSISDLLSGRPPSAARQPERQAVPTPPTVVVESPKPEKSHHKSKKDKVKSNSSDSTKDETKKRKRKNKEAADADKEKDKKAAPPVVNPATADRSPSPPTPPPPTLMEPPTKIPKREDPFTKREESPAPPNNNNNTSTTTSKLLSPEDSGSSSAYYNNNNTASSMASPALPPPPAPTSAVPGSAAATMTNLSGDYMSELKDLQHKIMTLQDNNELQRVVEMIAATGCYEITSATFDFDLCALDRHTVQRLQEFFATSCSS
ncbi:hypothetical protein quinque_000829 [Culex quinquefasciatus]